MVNVDNPEVVDRISEDGKISPAHAINRTLNNSIQPVLISNPKIRGKVLGTVTVAVTTTGTAVFTSNSSRDVIVTGVSLDYQCNSAADNTSVSVTAIEQGTTTPVILAQMVKLSGAIAQSREIFVNLPHIRLERGSAVNYISVFTLGAQRGSATVYGYEVDTLVK